MLCACRDSWFPPVQFRVCPCGNPRKLCMVYNLTPRVVCVCSVNVIITYILPPKLILLLHAVLCALLCHHHHHHHQLPSSTPTKEPTSPPSLFTTLRPLCPRPPPNRIPPSLPPLPSVPGIAKLSADCADPVDLPSPRELLDHNSYHITKQLWRSQTRSQLQEQRTLSKLAGS